MFDAKSLIEMMMKGAAPQQPQNQQGGGMGGLADILGQLGQAGGQGGQANAQGGGLADILGKMMGGGQGGQPQQPQAQNRGDQGDQGGGGMGGLEDLLRKAQAQMGGQSGQGGGQSAGGGGLMDILGQVLGQATSGVKEGARRVDDATGASGHLGGAVRGATGQSPDDIMAQVKDWIAKNPGLAGLGAGGLGAAVLGTKTGRSMAGHAAKIGGIAMIGGLAYKALQNYQAGRPLISGPDQDLAPAPQGSGFDVGAVTNDSATVYIRGMIAAAAADGRLDASEHDKIVGSLKQAGAGPQAEAFIAQELNRPASIAELAAGVKSAEEAVQLWTAARITVDVDNADEQQFLVQLADALGIDNALMQHIDAAARAAA